MRKSPAKAKAGRRVRGRKLGPKVALKNLVSKMLNRKMETKTAPASVINASGIDPYGLGTNPLIPTIIDLRSPLTNIIQGVGEGQRVGNRINIRKFWFKGFVTIPDAAAGTNTLRYATSPRYLKMIIFKQKNTNEIPTDMSDFYQNGNVDVAPQNQPQDMYAPFNKDKYTIYATRTFKLGRASYDYDATATFTASIANNDFSLSKYFSVDLTKFVRNNVIYNDTTPANPQNVGLYCTFVMTFADGSTITSTQYPQHLFSGVINCTYKDS